MVSATVCALLLMLAALLAMRSRPTGSAVIKIDSNGTSRLGPVSLSNTNVRDVVFTAVAHLHGGTVSVSAAESARMSDFTKTALAMRQAGITSVTVRWEAAPK